MKHEIYIDIVFDKAPSHEQSRLIEVEDNSKRSVNIGEWIKRDGGYWVLRIRDSDISDLYV